ncbi:MAG: thioredoxin domain-containing protein [Alphaproteobacteria bacterium]|nr:thioredoxin domain-containing protein [Alphaproteobacteria bacterium]
MTDFSRNNLDRETSPYLLQHRDNPVHWQPWGQAALDQAQATSKPILLSVGYAACHWCHVMAHESFEDPAIAALMNELFVNIKVDREERPDIDSIYQTALALLGEQGGWPLTMFLTARGEPFWGGTYFPPAPRYGRPGFADVLKRVAEIYRTDAETIEKNRTALLGALKERARTQRPDGGVPDLSPALLERIAERLLREVDPVHGGLGTAPKFPQCPILELIWRSHLRSGRAEPGAAVTNTLERMCQGGIYDHLGGGFARYSTDQQWLVPHFEKMLYDNAAMLELLCLVHARTASPLFEARIRETVDWVLREMVAEGGGFAATIDADSEGEEGRFYVWSAAEITELLGADAAFFAEAYDVRPGGNWEGHTILNRSHRPALRGAEEEARLAALRGKLLAARGKRVRPGWDDKVLADWNGLMIAALLAAAARLDEPAWIPPARRAFDFVATRMQQGDRLFHSMRGGERRHAGMLDDYAAMARAALALHEATGEGRFLDQAARWTATLDRHFWDAEQGGYFFTADDAEALIARTRHAHDNATPSGNGLMLEVLARLHHLTGRAEYGTRAEALLHAFLPEIGRNFFPLATFLNAAELLLAPVNVAVVGRREADDTARLVRAALGAGRPGLVLQVVAPDESLPAGHPAAAKPQLDGRATAYVCIGPTCSAPVTDAAGLEAVLAGR